MHNYYIGTAGWSYKDWEGIVYPHKKQSGFHPLIFLSQYINTVEINSTFYRIPVYGISLSWIKKIEHRKDFLFIVKLHQNFTHERKTFTNKDVADFLSGIDPLYLNNRLGAVLAQFPWSFRYSPENVEHLKNLFGLFSRYPLALEIRHGSWNQENFFDLLRENNVGFCNIDQPVIGDSIKPTAVTTASQFSYVRLHGRNYKNWFKKDAGRDERYNYLYNLSELEEWVEKIKELGNKSNKVFVITNNHYRGQALTNALQIKNLLIGEKIAVPEDLLDQYSELKDIIKQNKKEQPGLFEENN
ncbi:MAG: DUF72 domain-containing protein [Candidatus Aminicenantes bacterium]|nr:DUF72 domain-containing protein [Candidatus Aminicenantes bacterium]